MSVNKTVSVFIVLLCLAAAFGMRYVDGSLFELNGDNWTELVGGMFTAAFGILASAGAFPLILMFFRRFDSRRILVPLMLWLVLALATGLWQVYGAHIEHMMQNCPLAFKADPTITACPA